MADKDGLADLHPDTLLVHGGTLRSSFGETSEALFLTSGYVYNNAAEAEARRPRARQRRAWRPYRPRFWDT